MLKVCYIPINQVSQLKYQNGDLILLIRLKSIVLQPTCFFHVSVTLGTLAMSVTKWHQQSATK